MKIPVLDDSIDIKNNAIFLSDLEQTKGFEFDKVIILNVNEGDFPNKNLPEDEWFREYSKLYVSMTRAKKELIISYSSKLSNSFKDSKELFNENTEWADYFENSKDYLNDLDLETLKNTFNLGLDQLNGLQFVMGSQNLSVTTQNKIKELVTGNNTMQDNFPFEWRNMDKFKSDLMKGGRLNPHMNRLLGKNVFEELKNYFSSEIIV